MARCEVCTKQGATHVRDDDGRHVHKGCVLPGVKTHVEEEGASQKRMMERFGGGGAVVQDNMFGEAVEVRGKKVEKDKKEIQVKPKSKFEELMEKPLERRRRPRTFGSDEVGTGYTRGWFVKDKYE